MMGKIRNAIEAYAEARANTKMAALRVIFTAAVAPDPDAQRRMSERYLQASLEEAKAEHALDAILDEEDKG